MRAVVLAATMALLAVEGRAELRFAQTVADAGEVRSGLPLVHRFPFTNPGPSAVEIVELRPSCGCVRPAPGRRVVQPGESGEMALEVHTLGEAAGDHRWTLQVASVANGVRSETTLVLTGRVVTEVSVRPGSLTIFAENAVQHELLLTDHRLKTLQVREVRSGASWLTGKVVEPLREGVATCRIALTIDAACPEGRREEVVSIHTDDPVYRELRVPVTVVKRARQRVTALPTSVHLRSASGGSRIVLLEDRENEAVVIERAEADHPALTCRWASGPGKRATLRIGVDASKASEASFSGVVRVTLNGSGMEPIEIPVTCEGTGRRD